MSFRGGRGGRGGRFGGGGRALGGAVARDEDGQIMFLEKREGPPPLFPPREMPLLPDIKESEERLVKLSRKLERSYRGSPYFQEKAEKDNVEPDDGMLTYTEKLKRLSSTTRAPLESVLKMSVKHFPAELLDLSKIKRYKAKPNATNPWKVHAGEELKRLELLERIEKKLKNEDGDDEDGEKKKAEDGEEEVEEEAEDDDDGEYGELLHFDDDDDYDDGADDGDDEGATY